MSDAKIYIRRNGSFGAECDGVRDTGYHITEDSGQFTVYSLDDDETPIAEGVSRGAAEKVIAADWRKR